MQHKESLSAYMDGDNVSGGFTETLCQDEALQKKWVSYHLARSVMRGEDILLGADFSAKMEALIENETIEKAPAQSEKPRGLLLTLKRWSMPLMQAGIAASVCLMAVFGVNYLKSGDEVAQQLEQPILQTLPLASSIQTVSYNTPTKEQPSAEQLEDQQRRLNVLIQNHELQRRTMNSQVTPTEEEKAKAQTSAVETQTPQTVDEK